MYDGYHDDWARADAEQIVQARGCQDCASFAECEAEGACLLHLAIEEEDECSDAH
jgi:hypothetical protein